MAAATPLQQTYLQLCQAFCGEVGTPVSSLSTVANQSGQLLRMVNWITRAWTQIQTLHQDWRFMRRTATWTTVTGQHSYLLANATITDMEGTSVSSATLDRWLEHSFRNYITSVGKSGEIPMMRQPYEDYRDLWLRGANASVKSRPYQVALAPDDAIAIGPAAPDNTYTLYGDFYAGPVKLVNDGDIALLPAKFDPMIIVYRAMMAYGEYWGNVNVFNSGKRQYEALMTALENDQLPKIHFAGALA